MKEAFERLLEEIATLNGCRWTLQETNFGNRMVVSFVFADSMRSWTHWISFSSLRSFREQFRDGFVPACRNARMKMPGDEVKPVSCKVCGGELVKIRGRHPKDELKRIVCPTCQADTLHDISLRVSPNYNTPATDVR